MGQKEDWLSNDQKEETGMKYLWKKNQNDDDGLHKINLNATQNEKKKKYRKKMVKKKKKIGSRKM